MNDPPSFESRLIGARKFLRHAMCAHVSQDYDLFAINAGITTEVVAKAALFKRNLSPPAEMNNENMDTLIHPAGIKKFNKKKPVGLRNTIGQLREIGVLPKRDPKLDLIADMRNQVAHTAALATTDDLLTTFARTIDLLLKDIGENRESFWGDWSEPASLAARESCDKTTLSVSMRIANARHLLREDVSGFRKGAFIRYEPPDRKYAEKVQVVLGPNGITYTSVVKCPACEGQAREKKIVMLEDVSDGRATVTTRISCKFCGIFFHGNEEVERAGFQPTSYVYLTENSAFARTVSELLTEPSHRIKNRAGEEWNFPDLRKKETWQIGEPDDVEEFWPVIAKFDCNAGGDILTIQTTIVR